MIGSIQSGADENLAWLSKFMLDYLLLPFSYVMIVSIGAEISKTHQAAPPVKSALGTIMFLLTFLSLGTITDLSKLKEMSKLAQLYAIALFGIIARFVWGGVNIPSEECRPP